MENIIEDFIHFSIDNVDQLIDQNDKLCVNNDVHNEQKYDKVSFI